MSQTPTIQQRRRNSPICSRTTARRSTQAIGLKRIRVPPKPMTTAPKSPLRSSDKMRELTAQDLGLVTLEPNGNPDVDTEALPREIADDDSHLLAARELSERFGGVIF